LSAVDHHINRVMYPIKQHFIFRIPYGETITTIAPFHVIVSSAHSIPLTQSIEINCDIPHTFPFLPHLTKLVFGATFNQTADNLPDSLTSLEFGTNFNQEVNHLPVSLTHLSFGNSFNHQMDHLPTSLTHLFLNSNQFNQPTSKSFTSTHKRCFF